MKRTITYTAAVMTVGVLLLPAFALAATIDTPTVPVGVSGDSLSGSQIVTDIQVIVNYVVELSVVVAIAFFIYGAIRYATGNPEVGTATMKNAAIGLFAMLAVGLLVNTISSLVANGLNIG